MSLGKGAHAIFKGPDVCFASSARAMNQAPVSCIPAGKMSKAKKVLDEAREIQNPELDLADKNISTFEEVPGLREFLVLPICPAPCASYQIRHVVENSFFFFATAASAMRRRRGCACVYLFFDC